ncbi:MAG: hypothetical protein CL833_15980 [Crocinitomicaceae bacterium]|jgi:hypothetical protein|nr:hypothetical protein [Crocinitomicaceae bacterium]|tara:strand:- start:3094 stop:3489 length:396 start_codon:yes stop_codon:yes gene_type:complete
MSNALLERREELRTVISELKEELSDVNQKIQDVWLGQVRDALRADGKDFGTTKIVSGNKKFKATVRKKVIWDQDKLRNELNSMSPENAQHYGKVVFSVEERKYTAAPPEIKQQLEDCRTVEIGSFSFEEDV